MRNIADVIREAVQETIRAYERDHTPEDDGGCEFCTGLRYAMCIIDLVMEEIEDADPNQG